jgi:hypothetical protein
MDPKNPKLFHLLVVLGASLTAGAIEACSSGGSGDIDPQAQKDAEADRADGYGHIADPGGPDAYPRISELEAGRADVYPKISADPPPKDAAIDAVDDYANIMPAQGDI